MRAGFGIGWRQVVSCFLLLASVAFIAAGYGVIAVPLGREFQPSRMVLMLTMTILSGCGALLSPLLGSLMDRVSIRLLMIVGSLCLAAGYAALSFAGSFVQVLVVFALLLAPANVLIGPVAATVLVSRWFVKRRGAAMGIAIAGIAMGSVVYPPVVQWLIDHNDWRQAFRLLALLLLAVNLPAALLVVDRPASRGLHPDGAAADAAPDRPTDTAVEVSARTILTDPAFWLAAATFAVVLAGMKGMVTNLVPAAVDQGIAASDAALLISIFGASGFVAKLGFAAVSDSLSPRVLMLVSLGGFAAGMACLTQAATGYGVLALGVGLIGMFGGLMVPMQGLLVSRMFGHRIVGRAMGLMSMVTLCALLSTPPLFGLIYDVTGSYAAIFWTFAALGIAVMAVVRYLRLQAVAAQPGLAPG